MIFLLAVPVRPALFVSVTVTRPRILRFSLRILKLLFDNLILSVTLPPAGTVNGFFAMVTRLPLLLVPLRRTFLTLLKTALPASPAVAWKLKRKRRARFTAITDFEPAKVAGEGGVAVAGEGGVATPPPLEELVGV